MRYDFLPPVGAMGAPNLPFLASPNQSARSRQPEVLFNHVWGGGTFPGVVDWLRNPHSDASAHIVYAGEVGRHAGEIVQLVPFAKKAWTECDLNNFGISVETADAVWNGQDPGGFARLARINALILHLHGWSARWVKGWALLRGSATGHTRHADGGRLGCGHELCPTGDLELYAQFTQRVTLELRHGSFRKEWGR